MPKIACHRLHLLSTLDWWNEQNITKLTKIHLTIYKYVVIILMRGKFTCSRSFLYMNTHVCNFSELYLWIHFFSYEATKSLIWYFVLYFNHLFWHHCQNWFYMVNNIIRKIRILTAMKLHHHLVVTVIMTHSSLITSICTVSTIWEIKRNCRLWNKCHKW